MENANNGFEKLIVSSSPHYKTDRTTSKIMLDVIIALMPALIGSAYFFGLDSFRLTVISVVSTVLFEALTQKLMKKPITINDFSAVITGLLLAMNLPATAPWWVPVFGAGFAIIIVKQFFGGLGSNFMNPALAARAAIMLSWPSIMSKFTIPSLDGITSATPMFLLKGGTIHTDKLPSLMDMLIGNIGGCIGETSALLLLVGGIYLIIRKVIDWQTPLFFILSTVITLFFLGVRTELIPYHVLGGGLFLGAFFMATDYASSPISKKGKIIFAIGCGLLTALIRVKGGMPEGVSYSILFMNITVPIIERFAAPRIFGRSKK